MPVLLRTAVALAALVAALGLLAGCGDSESDGGDGGGAATQADPDASPTEVFLAFQKDLAAGDAEGACAALGPSALDQVEAETPTGTCAAWVDVVSGVLDDTSRSNLENTEVRNEKIEGANATLTFKDPIIDIPATVELERTDGAWLISKLFSFVA